MREDNTWNEIASESADESVSGQPGAASDSLGLHWTAWDCTGRPGAASDSLGLHWTAWGCTGSVLKQPLTSTEAALDRYTGIPGRELVHCRG
jgi:hypothetical protein